MFFKSGLNIFFGSLILCVSSCSLFNNKEDNQKLVLASVFDKKLYKSEVLEMLPDKISSKDSINFVKNFIENWIQQNILIHKAESNLGESTEAIEKQLQDYKNSLIIYEFEKQLVDQKLDTIVKESEIEKYYKDNPSNFELKENIIKVNFIKVNRKAPKIDKLKLWYKSDNANDKKLLEQYCLQYAENYFLDDESWLLFNDLIKEIPIKTYDQEHYLQNNRYIELQDSEYYYFVNIKGFKIKEAVSPLSFEKENIRNIIINKRKVKLIDQMKTDIYNEAKKNKDFEILEND